MPTYEYACKECGENFEAVQSFSDKPLKTHKAGCGGPVQKVFHARGVVFKGSGFYATDSRSKPSSSKPGSGSSESKTAKKTPDSASKSKTSSSSPKSDAAAD